jgi:flavin reductase (DIM6/NTAB) family NADH-FMN oxidoreductase RutF
MATQTEIPLEQLAALPFHLWNRRWFLLAAGEYLPGPGTPGAVGSVGAPVGFNVMTVSWGGLGVMWNKPFALVVVRPTRHTRAFMDHAASFTLSVLPEARRKILDYCGSRSGRDEDKVKAAGLTPRASHLVPAPSFEEAELVLECRKSYFSDLDPAHFLDPAINAHYPSRDYHRVYFGEVLAAAGTAAWSANGRTG